MTITLALRVYDLTHAIFAEKRLVILTSSVLSVIFIYDGGQAEAGCYSQAAFSMSSNDSKTRYIYEGRST